jgi:hypothetical protein
MSRYLDSAAEKYHETTQLGITIHFIEKSGMSLTYSNWISGHFGWHNDQANTWMTEESEFCSVQGQENVSCAQCPAPFWDQPILPSYLYLETFPGAWLLAYIPCQEWVWSYTFTPPVDCRCKLLNWAQRQIYPHINCLLWNIPTLWTGIRNLAPETFHFCLYEGLELFYAFSVSLDDMALG